MSTFYGRGRAPERACQKLHAWPDQDRGLWNTALEPGSLLELGGARSELSVVTNRNVERGYGRWLTWLDRNGLLDREKTPASRITPDRVKAYVADLQKLGNGSETVLGRLKELGCAAAVFDPAADWAWIGRIAAKVRAAYQSVRQKRNRLKGADELHDVGLRLMAEADNRSTARQQAIIYRDGLIIALLSIRPFRLRNLAALQLGQQLCRDGETWQLRLPAAETKTGNPLELPWPSDLVPQLEAYLARHRPILVSSRGRWSCAVGNSLWVSSDGSPMTMQNHYDRIVRHTKAAFGQAINPHLFRDAVATTFAIHDPLHVRAAGQILGHRTYATTEQHYVQATAIEASRKYQGCVLGLRSGRKKEKT